MELRFAWDDSWFDCGRYKCELFENEKKIDEISFTDYTCEFRQGNDKKCGYTRPYAFEVYWCSGWSMREGFDYDDKFDRHCDEKGHTIGGYQGNCTHTVDDIKKWCEEWLAKRYIQAYENMIKDLETMKNRYDWFKNNGYGNYEFQEDILL